MIGNISKPTGLKGDKGDKGDTPSIVFRLDEDGNLYYSSDGTLIEKEYLASQFLVTKNGEGESSVVLNDKENNIAQGKYSLSEGHRNAILDKLRISDQEITFVSYKDNILTLSADNNFFDNVVRSKRLWGFRILNVETYEHLDIVKVLSATKDGDNWNFEIEAPTDELQLDKPYHTIVQAILNDESESGAHSHAEGWGNVITGRAGHVEGYNNQLIDNYGHAEGGFNVVGYSAHGEGGYNKATGNYAHCEGWHSEATGEAAHAEGVGAKAVGKHSHSEGWRCQSEGDYAHSEGNGSKATEESTHAEGYETEASGLYSHAEGQKTKSEGTASHTEGKNTVAKTEGAHAEGLDTVSQGNGTHAEGCATKSYSDGSHSEGWGTEAIGRYSHSEGRETKAKGNAAHTEGTKTQALSDNTHSEGKGTIAEGPEQHVQGRYNVKDTRNEYADIVGGGTSDTDRKNIYTLDWDGNAMFAGNITFSYGGKVYNLGEVLEKLLAN